LYFLNADFLPNSQDALRDLTWARLQTNLRLLKYFLGSQMKLLYHKSKSLRNHELWHNYVDSWQKSPYNLYFLNANFLPNSQGALRDLTWARLQTNLRLWKKFLEISDEALIQKIRISRKSWNHDTIVSIVWQNLLIIGVFQILILCQTH